MTAPLYLLAIIFHWWAVSTIIISSLQIQSILLLRRQQYGSHASRHESSGAPESRTSTDIAVAVGGTATLFPNSLDRRQFAYDEETIECERCASQWSRQVDMQSSFCRTSTCYQYRSDRTRALGSTRWNHLCTLSSTRNAQGSRLQGKL